MCSISVSDVRCVARTPAAASAHHCCYRLWTRWPLLKLSWLTLLYCLFLLLWTAFPTETKQKLGDLFQSVNLFASVAKAWRPQAWKQPARLPQWRHVTLQQRVL